MTPKAEKLYPIKYIVEGGGEFPIDMLRYDRAIPASEKDSNVIRREGGTELVTDERGNTGWTSKARQVQLIRFSSAGKSGPNAARWRSFGWRVLQVEYSDGTIEQA